MLKVNDRFAAGHRKRVSNRFNDDYYKTCEDYELLEYLLFKIIPRIDTKPLAKKLLSVFGGVPGIMSASKEKLLSVPGIGLGTANYLCAMSELARRGLRKNIKKIRIANYKDLLEYIDSLFEYCSEEKLYMLCIGGDYNLIAKYSVEGGTSTEIKINPADLCKKAVSSNAKYIIFAHNHMDLVGDLKPSSDDILMTKEMIVKLSAFDIVVAEHIIVNASSEIFSLRQSGMLEDCYIALKINYSDVDEFSTNLKLPPIKRNPDDYELINQALAKYNRI